jgi:TonB family protein
MNLLARLCAILFLVGPFSFSASSQQPQTSQNAAPTVTTLAGPAEKSPISPAAPAPPDSARIEPIKIEKADYPLLAEEKGIQGQVMLTVHISETGDVEGVEVLSGDPVLVPSAVAAAKKCKFKPFIKNGKPIKVSAKLPYDFAFTDKVTDVASATSTASGAPLSKPIRIGSGVASGLLIHKVQPIYPREARAYGIQGTVILQACIGRDGRIKDLTFVSGPKELAESAIGAVQQWRYRPFVLNGQPVEVMTQVQVNYRLSGF